MSIDVAQLAQPARHDALVERWNTLPAGNLDSVRASLAWTVGLIA